MTNLNCSYHKLFNESCFRLEKSHFIVSNMWISNINLIFFFFFFFLLIIDSILIFKYKFEPKFLLFFQSVSQKIEFALKTMKFVNLSTRLGKKIEVWEGQALPTSFNWGEQMWGDWQWPTKKGIFPAWNGPQNQHLHRPFCSPKWDGRQLE